ncbi:MAG: hypothetical protein JWP16_2670 [Alphaproteobacteria bacterium]|jgi:hypothetical protein|nr:hypothetical protein [Alphaproteobacteria bacterium]MDB5741630.1 hypothetical protein [Alphaproteobacteria bacterium]
MVHKLALVAVTGLAISAVCLGGAAAIGGKDMTAGAVDLSFFGDGPSCDFTLSGKTGSRSIAWDNSDRVSIQMHADTHYKRGQGDQVVVTGDTALIPHVKVEDGDIKMDCRRASHGDTVAITLPGRIFEKFGMAGSGTMTLDDIDQPKVKLGLAGSGDIRANGKADELDVGIAGSGKAKLGQLAANTIKIHIAGSGDTEIAPKDDLEVHIAGSGNVRLLSEPRHLTTHIAGSGNIIHGQ